MARLPAAELVQAIEDAVTDSGSSATLSSSLNRNPREFWVQGDRAGYTLWAYIWTLTHGGGAARPKDEYRIQLTGVQPPLEANVTGGPTILIGYEPNTRCFAGFDLGKHRRFSVNSPSIQIPITTLHQALQDGLAFSRKGNEEIAIGFRPDQFLVYALNADLLHSQGADARTFNLLERAAALETIRPAELVSIGKDRRRIVDTVSRLARDSSFRIKVMHAYDRRCAVTRMQLRLVDAAHILPVGAKGSNDEVANGICLSPTYHRAFDRGLIYLDQELVMRINTHKEDELRTLGLAGGIDDFKYWLGRRVHLPADHRQWPNLQMVRRANEFREIGA